MVNGFIQLSIHYSAFSLQWGIVSNNSLLNGMEVEEIALLSWKRRDNLSE